MNRLFTLLILSLLISFGNDTWAGVSLPALISDGMVLQRNSSVTLWGWAKPQEEVSITLGWNRQTVRAKADVNARWSVLVNTPEAGGPYEIAFKASNFLLVNDVLIGEVWLCSGQSNMEWTPAMGIDNAQEEIDNSTDDNLRFFTVANAAADGLQNDCNGNWVKSVPYTMKDFSAAAYFFGKELRKKLGVPVALINASWGGSNIETWMDPEWIRTSLYVDMATLRLPESDYVPTKPGKLFNAMIAPISNYKIAGMLWYQGESNLFNAGSYGTLLGAMVNGFRAVWGYQFPFYYAQIAPYNYGENDVAAHLRDEQRRAQQLISNSGMIVLSDVGDYNDVHPRNKQAVGTRFAALALKNNYGFENLSAYGPVYQTIKNEGNKIRVVFDMEPGESLVAKGGNPTGFYVASVDRQFHKADAKIVGNTIIVSSPKVKFPVAVRYAFDNAAAGNIFNSSGLPASCFRSENWPMYFE